MQRSIGEDGDLVIRKEKQDTDATALKRWQGWLAKARRTARLRLRHGDSNNRKHMVTWDSVEATTRSKYKEGGIIIINFDGKHADMKLDTRSVKRHDPDVLKT